MLKSLLLLLACAIASAQGPTVLPLHKSIKDHFSAASGKPTSARHALDMPGDDVIPHFVNGDGWKTTIVLVNLEVYAVDLDLYFVGDFGDDMPVPIVGVGTVAGVSIHLPPGCTTNVESDGSGYLEQGWALLGRDVDDSVGGFAIFRQSVPGRQDQEAVVPFTSWLNSRTVLPFDNVGTSTGLAMAYPLPWGPITIDITIRDDKGAVLGVRTGTLRSGGHAAFDVAQKFPETTGKRGTLDFNASDVGIAVLGLRFNGAAFTSFHSFENFDWMLP